MNAVLNPTAKPVAIAKSLGIKNMNTVAVSLISPHPTPTNHLWPLLPANIANDRSHLSYNTTQITAFSDTTNKPDAHRIVVISKPRTIA